MRVKLLVFLMFSLPCFSQAADSVIGKWRGSQIQDGLPVVVTIEIKELTLGDRSTILGYALPRQCKVVFEYAGAHGGNDIFYVSQTNSSTWCAKNLKAKGSHLKVKVSEDGDLLYELFKGAAARVEGGVIKRL